MVSEFPILVALFTKELLSFIELQKIQVGIKLDSVLACFQI